MDTASPHNDAPCDAIPLEDVHDTHGPDAAGQMTHRFYAFNTIVTLQAYAPPERCRRAFERARAACRTFERKLSRTLPHSDIARLNAAQGRPVTVGADTAQLLRAALDYCADSEGRFDITMGAAVRLWDFHRGRHAGRRCAAGGALPRGMARRPRARGATRVLGGPP